MTASVTEPHRSTGSPGYLDGKLQIWCEGTEAPSVIWGRVKLQKRVAGVWVDVKGTDGERTISPVKLGKKNKYVVWTQLLKCQRGTFRTAAEGGGTLNGKKVQSAWKYSQTVNDPCG